MSATAQVDAPESVAAGDGGTAAADAVRTFEPGFTILGHGLDGTTVHVFSHSSRQIVEFNATRATDGHLLSLRPDINWWEAHFPRGGGTGINRGSALAFLIATAHTRGVFNPDNVRGRGAWVDRDRSVLHMGNRLLVDRVETPLAQIRSSHFYPGNLALPAPSENPLTDDEATLVLRIANQFRWRRPASALLLAGWIALAPLCGALRWRPHVWITGGPGSGKTSIMESFVHLLANGGPKDLAGWAVFVQGNTTEAGLRQTLRDDALPVVFDEAESNEETDVRRVQNVLALARQASSETIARVLKGTTSGEAMSFRIRSMFAFSSIQVPLKQQADVERVTVLELRPKRDAPNHDAWKRLVDDLAVISRDDYALRLLRRSINLLPITLRNIATFKAEVAKRFGSQRDGDQFGTLLAGAWSLHSSTEATAEQARQRVDSFEWSDFVDADDDRDSVINALFGRVARLNSGEEVLVGALVRRADNRKVEGVCVKPDAANAALALYGLKVSAGWLFVANRNVAARTELMKGTHFASMETMRRSLRELPGSDNNDNQASHFAGLGSAKCVRVRLASILSNDLADVDDGCPL